MNVFLGNVAKQLVLKRITRLDAIALTHVPQSLLNSHLAVERQFEIALDAARREEHFDGVFRLKRGTSHVPVPPTASTYRDDVKTVMEGGGPPSKRSKRHVPLPATASGFVEEVFAQAQRKKGDTADKEGVDRGPASEEDK